MTPESIETVTVPAGAPFEPSGRSRARAGGRAVDVRLKRAWPSRSAPTSSACALWSRRRSPRAPTRSASSTRSSTRRCSTPARSHQILLRAVPIVLAALAVSVPARAGLVNVGGEGQLIVGAVGATGVGVDLLGPGVPVPSGGCSCARGNGRWSGLGRHRRCPAGARRRQRGGHDAAYELHRQRHPALPALPALEGPGRNRPAGEPPADRQRDAAPRLRPDPQSRGARGARRRARRLRPAQRTGGASPCGSSAATSRPPIAPACPSSD